MGTSALWKLRNLGYKVVVAELVENPSDVKHAAWRTVFTKLRLWQMPYEKIVYMDADQLVLQSITELFDYPELSAVPDCCPPSVFNSGILVLKPSQQTFDGMLA